MQGGLLVNAEVYDLIKQQQQHRIKQEISDPSVEFFHTTVTRYIESAVSKPHNTIDVLTKIKKLIISEDMGLTEGETVQLLNACPQHAVEVHLIIEECSERLNDEQVDRVLAIFAEFAPLPPAPVESEGEMVVEEQA